MLWRRERLHRRWLRQICRATSGLLAIKTPVVTTKETPFEIGKASICFQPITGKPDVGIIATGPLLYKALKVAQELEKQKIGAVVLNLSTIKPLDEKAVIRLAQEAKAIVTVEDHQIAGGMGSAVAECLAQHAPTHIEFVGVRNLFGQSGTPEELIEHYEMGETHIIFAVKKVPDEKNRSAHLLDFHRLVIRWSVFEILFNFVLSEKAFLRADKKRDGH